jgi:anaerobic C4-dicarboxylate transporter DcuA
MQFIVILLAIFIGARLKGIGLGVMGGLGLSILTFIFHVQPNKPPINVLLIIISVVTAASTLENAGGLKYLVKLAEKVIRKHPSQITFIAPIVTYLFTFLSGTTHISYSILPVIAEVSRETGVRPERPLSASVTAAQQAITASPISAATATLISLLGPQGIELIHILMICVPATLLGVVMCSVVANKIGKELNEDPICIERIKKIKMEEEKSKKKNESEESKYGKISILIFLLGIVLIVMFGSFKNLRPK